MSINEAELGERRKFTATVAFPQSRVSTGVSEDIMFVTGPGGTPGPPGPPGKDAKWESLTQEQFDAIAVPDPNTLYVIVP